MPAIQERIDILNQKLSSRSEKEKKKFDEEFDAIREDNQYCLLYGIKNFLDLNPPIEQIISAKEKLYFEMFGNQA